VSGRPSVAGLGPPQLLAVGAVQRVDELAVLGVLVVAAADEDHPVVDGHRDEEPTVVGVEPPDRSAGDGVGGVDDERLAMEALAAGRNDE
jgi:hypothetical protein